jgi:asparagine synthase (glutamine-hydrolysing)
MYSKDTKIKLDDFIKGFDRIKARGPDMSKVITDETGIWGFHRLAIMDLSEHGMQPFELDGSRLICNGEIYHYKLLKKEVENDYEFKSSSDCEVLLPLYRKFGFDMFNMLDAEFALVMYDAHEKEIIAARDPIGIRPLFYGYSKLSSEIMFASEAKALIDLCNGIMPFPVGNYYYKGEFHQYHDASKYSKYIDGDIDEITKGIKDRLYDGVVKRLDADAPLGFLLSGGLDSSLVCAIASDHLKKHGKKIKTFAIGMSTDAIDLKYARIVADYIDSEHTEVIITKDDVIGAVDEVIRVLETFDITTIRASIGMYLLCKYIHEHTDVKVLMTGEISDELFGYKYTDFAPSPLEFQCESEKRIKELYMYDVLRADRCISSNGIEGRVPFGDLAFVDYVMGINPEKKINKYNKGKYLLRKAFEGDYLPESILMREKAAFSDAVGHSLVDYLKSYANELYTDEDVEKSKIKYAYHSSPFTKESLMYRDIFEKYYPGEAKWIVDYWMPNKEWEGCNVNDPSARVLSNYGTSGK